jgi:hypothetical protein
LVCPEAGCASIVWAATPPAELSSPALARIPRATTNFFGGRPPLALRSVADAAPIASGLSIAIEAAVVAG